MMTTEPTGFAAVLERRGEVGEGREKGGEPRGCLKRDQEKRWVYTVWRSFPPPAWALSRGGCYGPGALPWMPCGSQLSEYKILVGQAAGPLLLGTGL